MAKTTTSSDGDIFATTRWTMVLNAAGENSPDTACAASALTELCGSYWYPLYAYVRHRGHGPHDAEDLVQGFFSKLLRLHSLAGVSPEKGKFRAFLLASLKNYLTDEWRRASAEKRDQRLTFSLDAEAAEARYAREPVETLTPERLYDRRWAMTLLETVMANLADDYEAAGRGEIFRKLRFSITGDRNPVPYRELAQDLDMSEEAVRVAAFRLRKAYRRALENEIAHTVSRRTEVREELESLRRILAEA